MRPSRRVSTAFRRSEKRLVRESRRAADAGSAHRRWTRCRARVGGGEQREGGRRPRDARIAQREGDGSRRPPGGVGENRGGDIREDYTLSSPPLPSRSPKPRDENPMVARATRMTTMRSVAPPPSNRPRRTRPSRRRARRGDNLFLRWVAAVANQQPKGWFQLLLSIVSKYQPLTSLTARPYTSKYLDKISVGPEKLKSLWLNSRQ